MVDTEYLNNEREKLWERLTNLERQLDEINKSIPQGIIEFQKNINSINKLKGKYKVLNQQYNDIENKVEFIQNNASQINELISDINKKAEVVNTNYEDLPDKIQELKDLVEENSSLPSKLEKMGETASESEKIITQIKNNLSNSNDTKSQIIGIYEEINGYDEKDAQGNIVHREGTKDILENTYDNLESKLETLQQEQSKIIADTISTWENKYKDLEKKIRSLLPSAMTTGLAHAYSRKVFWENCTRLFMFVMFICSLVAISYIGIKINVVWYMKILYSLPLFWLAIFCNKQVNLCKKLIEAYEHKKVVARTFEGLSKQIKEIDDNDISNKLSIQLLQQTLDANAENPSKCITNYNCSDNPILELLGNSNIAKILTSRNGKTFIDAILNLSEKFIVNKPDNYNDLNKNISLEESDSKEN